MDIIKNKYNQLLFLYSIIMIGGCVMLFFSIDNIPIPELTYYATKPVITNIPMFIFGLIFFVVGAVLLSGWYKYKLSRTIVPQN